MFESEAHIERGSPSLVGRGIDNQTLDMRFTLKHNNINSFEDYLKAKKSRNTRQIMCYAQRYSNILDTGDASPLVNLSTTSGSIRRHTMEALTAYSKHLGCYDRWQQIRKRYSLHWTDGNESLQALQRFFNPESTLEIMLQRIKEMIACTPYPNGQYYQVCMFGWASSFGSARVCKAAQFLAARN